MFTVAMLAVYRLLVFIPIPFADISVLVNHTLNAGSDFGYFVMLLGGALDQFAFIAIGISPYITASIIMQLLGIVLPAVEKSINIQDIWLCLWLFCRELDQYI